MLIGCNDITSCWEPFVVASACVPAIITTNTYTHTQAHILWRMRRSSSNSNNNYNRSGGIFKFVHECRCVSSSCSVTLPSVCCDLLASARVSWVSHFAINRNLKRKPVSLSSYLNKKFKFRGRENFAIVANTYVYFFSMAFFFSCYKCCTKHISRTNWKLINQITTTITITTTKTGLTN